MLAVSIQQIRRKFRHLYYQDGPVKPEHLIHSALTRSCEQKEPAFLVGFTAEVKAKELKS